MNVLATIATLAAEKNLLFLLAGGHAVIAHGYPRTTFDLDLIVRRRDQKAWLELAQSLEYNLHHEGPTFLQFNPAKQPALPLDLMLVNDETMTKLLAQAVPAPPSAGGAKMVSLLHLLALKCHALKHGHPGRIVKDTDDVIRLIHANRLDVCDPTVREIFVKHGTPDLYEKIQRISPGC